VIVATSSPDRAFPSAAADVQGAIGAKHAVAFDITAACSGFIYALHIVQGFIQAGIYKTALIIGAETLSKVLDWTDRSSCILFGDGAGAAVVRADETGVVKTLVGSDGTKNDVLYCQARSLENCLTGGKPELGFMQMDGQEVFKFAVKKVPEIVNAILEETGTDREAVQHYLLHQANIRILEAASRRLKVPMDKIPETQALFLEDFKWEGHRRPALREVFDRTIRPSERAEKSALPRPDFPITRRIEEYKTLLIESGTWVDRDDKLTPEALEWLHWLGY
jgi:3-oxoacyl-[acyl-carrier-protein] synthase-3